MTDHIFLGIDFGTSGARAIAIDSDGQIVAEGRCPFIQDDPDARPRQWRGALKEVIGQIPAALRQRLGAIAINGTSATVLWCDAAGYPLMASLLYNDNHGQAVLPLVRAIAPDQHPVISASSSLAKWVWWQCQGAGISPELIDQTLRAAPGDREARRAAAVKLLERAAAALVHYPVAEGASQSDSSQSDAFQSDAFRSDSSQSDISQSDAIPASAGYFLHQADWLAFLLHGQIGISDYHNCLKLGYDVQQLSYPSWMQDLPSSLQMPRIVLTPGTAVAAVTPSSQAEFGLPPHCQVCAGTTDSIAAFVASGARQPGDAVTSLGSTLVIKLLSTTPINDATYGVYSHRLDGINGGDRPLWLVGGASNTGGAVLRQFFSDTEIARLSATLDPSQESPLDYYPLPTEGDRFPVNDPHLQPRLSPRPADDAAFLHGILESMARIEAQGYQLLEHLGASSLARIYTAGGGAKNAAWTDIRQRRIGVPVSPSPHTEAAYGSALLARQGWPSA